MAKAKKSGKSEKKAAKAEKTSKKVKESVKKAKGKKAKKVKGGNGDMPAAIARYRTYRAFEAPVDGDGVPNFNKTFALGNDVAEKLPKSAYTGKTIPHRAFVSHINATVFQQVLGAQLKHKQAQLIVEGIFDQLLSVAAKGGKVRIGNLFQLYKQNRAARKGRNPATGETIKIPAKTVFALRLIKAAKTYVMSKSAAKAA
jgi:DNA-binding protein HU-beta